MGFELTLAGPGKIWLRHVELARGGTTRTSSATGVEMPGITRVARVTLTVVLTCGFPGVCAGMAGACAGSRWRCALLSGSRRQHSLGLTPDAGHGGYARMNRMPTDHDPAGGISTRLTSPSAVSADPPRANDYDSIAEAYSAENEANLVNAYYERPAMLALAGDVAARILDAGCGAGPLFAALRDRGAIVTGFDKSAGMIELARRRLGGDADLQVADLGSALPFPDNTFDDVTASLVLHYLEDWGRR